jgi:hypothetical protein
MVGLAAALLLGLVGARPPVPARAGAVAGGLVGLLLVFASARRDRRLRAAVLLCQRLEQPDRREAAAVALRRLLDLADAERGRDLEGHARLLLVVVGPMTMAGLWDEAATRLATLAPESLAPHTRGLHAQALSTCHLQLGRLEDAASALAGAVRPVEDEETERWLRMTEALLLAVQGGIDEATALLETMPTPEDAALFASGRVVRAHVHACRGEDARAREELERLLSEAGPLALERVLRPVGPATDLARALLLGAAAEVPSEAGQSG